MHGRKHMLHVNAKRTNARAITAHYNRTCALQNSTFIMNSVEVDGDDRDDDEEDDEDAEDEAFIDDRPLSELSFIE